MKIVPPKPFTFEGGSRAVLLLHGFTGNSSDVRMLGRYLQDKGYTSHAPHYKGHGVPPEELVKTGPEDWWEDVKEGYGYLKSLGYEEIAVAGLSLGGIFTLKTAYNFPVKGIVTMCTPMQPKSQENIRKGVLKYAREWKQLEGKTKETIEKEMEAFAEDSMGTLAGLSHLIEEVRDHSDMVYAPALIAQATEDEMINPESADIIYKNIQSDQKKLNWYENGTHVITLSDAKADLHEDVYAFLEDLDWSV